MYVFTHSRKDFEINENYCFSIKGRDGRVRIQFDPPPPPPIDSSFEEHIYEDIPNVITNPEISPVQPVRPSSTSIIDHDQTTGEHISSSPNSLDDALGDVEQWSDMIIDHDVHSISSSRSLTKISHFNSTHNHYVDEPNTIQHSKSLSDLASLHRRGVHVSLLDEINVVLDKLYPTNETETKSDNTKNISDEQIIHLDSTSEINARLATNESESTEEDISNNEPSLLKIIIDGPSFDDSRSDSSHAVFESGNVTPSTISPIEKMTTIEMDVECSEMPILIDSTNVMETFVSVEIYPVQDHFAIETTIEESSVSFERCLKMKPVLIHQDELPEETVSPRSDSVEEITNIITDTSIVEANVSIKDSTVDSSMILTKLGMYLELIQ